MVLAILSSIVFLDFNRLASQGRLFIRILLYSSAF
jgi:hypothetical protein